MQLSLVGKNTDLIGILTFKNASVLGIRSLLIPFIYGDIHGLCISKTIHQEYNILLFDLFCHNNSFLEVVNHRFSFFAVCFLECLQFLNNNLCHRRTMFENILIFIDIG